MHAFLGAGRVADRVIEDEPGPDDECDEEQDLEVPEARDDDVRPGQKDHANERRERYPTLPLVRPGGPGSKLSETAQVGQEDEDRPDANCPPEVISGDREGDQRGIRGNRPRQPEERDVGDPGPGDCGVVAGATTQSG